MFEWTSKNGNWQIAVNKISWAVFFKGKLVTEQGRLFSSRNVPKNVQEKVQELIDQVRMNQ